MSLQHIGNIWAEKLHECYDNVKARNSSTAVHSRSAVQQHTSYAHTRMSAARRESSRERERELA